MTNIQNILNNIGSSPVATTNNRILNNLTKRKSVYVFKDSVLFDKCVSVKEADRKYSGQASTSIKKNRPSSQGYYFSYTNEYKPRNTKYGTNGKSIIVFKGQTSISKHKSIVSCAKETGLYEGCIRKCLNGKMNSYRGYTFKFE